MDTLSGSVERITFYNPENGYTVLRLRPEQRHTPGLNNEGLITVVGGLPEVAPGETLRLSGKWEKHPQHGMQFNVQTCEQSLPATVEGIRRYLGSGMIKGIGPRLADRIVKAFADKTLEVIEHQPELLVEVPDIGQKRTLWIVKAWDEQKRVKEIMLFLYSHSVSTSLAVKIFKQYGDGSLEVVQSDPYRLARDIYGVGFKTADKLAQALGLPPDHPSRMEAGLVFALNEMSNEGHVYSPRQALLDRATELLGIAPDLLPPALLRLEKESRIHLEVLTLIQPQDQPQKIQDETAIYLTPFYQGEIGVAERLKRLAGGDNPVDPRLSAGHRYAVDDPKRSFR
jgi:exodeoxyribonuclease V alpha subunit